MTFKPFSEMSAGDYAALGFKSGLEIHQQLLTSRKLFCRCPAGRYSDSFNAEILRHMRPTLSELGEYDGTALMEFKTRKEIIYQINHETVCTYEMDDTPPFELNDEALDSALEIGLLYGCSMVDEIHIARKQYLDGSIPTGFQRTTIVGVDGAVTYRGRTISIVQLGLEEDACREVSDVGHTRIYRTDRLGMPLIETVTAPDMRTPVEVAEVADLLRGMVRSTGRVRTGAGAARQDVNVSVEGGTRIEIKGVPRIPDIPLLTYSEAMRQHNLLLLRDELTLRGITPASFESRTDDVSRLLRKTHYYPLQAAVGAGQSITAVLLKNFKGLLQWPTQPHTYFSREISDRVRVVACLTTLPNIIHSDSATETLSSSEWQAVKKASGASNDDTIVIVWGSPQDARTGAAEIVIRAREAAVGIPSETRQALRDGTNGFERILPGPNRMYPDTDLPPRRITREHLGRIAERRRPPLRAKEQWYRDIAVPADLVLPLCLSPRGDLFAAAVEEWKIPPALAAVTLVQYPKRVIRRRGEPVEFSEETLREILLAYRDRLLAKEGILPALLRVAEGGIFSRSALAGPCSGAELDAIVSAGVAAVSGMVLHNPGKRMEVLMGVIMDDLRGRVDGAEMARHLARANGEGRLWQ
jgi:glutamyl-tRNA(Gln) amidotransferase subunit E